MRNSTFLLLVAFLFSFNFINAQSVQVGSCSNATGLLDSTGKVSEINVWPNPFNSDVLVELPDSEAFYNIRIFNFSGRLVHEQLCADKQIRLELGHLSGGTYLMVVSENGGTFTTKLIKK